MGSTHLDTIRETARCHADEGIWAPPDPLKYPKLHYVYGVAHAGWSRMTREERLAERQLAATEQAGF